jgi:hypothetical protein
MNPVGLPIFIWKKVAWGRFFRTTPALPAAKSVVFAAWLDASLRPGRRFFQTMPELPAAKSVVFATYCNA